ncbi:hypothetical protein LCGC14_1811520 [marine sediment metagenome]|uniref:Uncharacterized protein n=1 Tax=marine sediment metagenome TaxID=412755 RepID=A0A0F9JLA0_9ZZZZ
MATPEERLVAALSAAKIQNTNHFATLQRQIDLLVAYLLAKA